MSHYHLGVNTHDGEGDIFSNLCRCAWNDSLHFNQWTGYQMYVFFFSCYTLKGNNTMYNGSHYVYKKNGYQYHPINIHGQFPTKVCKHFSYLLINFNLYNIQSTICNKGYLIMLNCHQDNSFTFIL